VGCVTLYTYGYAVLQNSNPAHWASETGQERPDLASRWLRTIYEEFEIFPLGKQKPNSQRSPLALNPGHEDQVDCIALLVGVH